jgi:hypothetical protein
LAPVGRAAPSDDDYEAIVIANIHVQATSVQNILSLVSVTLDLSSTHYARWRDNVIFTHAMHFPSFQKVLNDLCLEEIQQGI